MLPDEKLPQNDPIASALCGYAQNILVIIFGLLPLLFIPSAAVPFEYTKVFIVIGGLLIALVLYSLSVLRSGVFSVGVSYPLLALWGIVGITFLSSFLSGDFRDSLVGDLFSIHSTAFVAILALIPTVWLLLKSSKAPVMRMYVLLALSTTILVVYHLFRLKFGQEFLSFSIFTSTTSTPVGSWNDLALFLGLTVILSLVALEQIALTKIGRLLFASVTLISLFMLGVINFFMVWLILGLTSLVMVVYSIGKERFSGNQLSFTPSISNFNSTSLTTSLIVFAVSALFVVGGATLGGAISKFTGVSYVEVRPSLEATADIARQVYKDNAFLGIGANKFTDAWRLYKDNSINSTPFWNTDFNAGNGYITTFFVTTGVFGGLAWLLFIVLYLITGIRKLLGATEDSDRMWYFIGLSSFVSAIYIWGMSIVYVPGAVILLLGALCTGVSLSAFSVLDGISPRIFFVGANRRSGFVLTLVVITVIIGSVSVLYVTGRHYSSVYTFMESVISMQQGKSIDELEDRVESAYKLSSSDVFARRIAEFQIARMNALMATKEPTEVQIEQFNNAGILGINAANQAVSIDGQEPSNWSVLANIYSILALVPVEGAQQRALDALAKSRELNPKSPLPYLESALLEARSGNVDIAREYIQQAINLKPNYTEAFFLLSQLEIATGNVEAAIKSSQSVITLEPNNPARYYQLGVLESSRDNIDGAIASFEKAISLDENFANARYLLALAYDQKGRSGEAKQQFEAVLRLNPGNEEVTILLQTIQTEGSLARLRESANQSTKIVNEATPVTDENGVVSTNQTSETDLVKPVNTQPNVENVASTTVQ
ncbi:tetratricopeptide repeat protein [Candidatus Kaiserbacteria bacterium]|nr:MAG: tetratricopeptide repeat protein [Candidatus Kaiserbacteria bacterium]